MKKTYMLIALFTSLLMFSLVTQKAKAWGPISHLMLVNEAIDEAMQTNADSEILRLINTHTEYFYCGYMFPDVTVIQYYTEFVSYHDTHKLAFYDTLWSYAESDQAKAFTIGVGTHMIQDAYIHNYYIPEKIRGTLVQNNIIHPITEAIIEARYITLNASAEAIASSAFTNWRQPFTDFSYTDEHGTRYLTPVEFVEIALGRDYTAQAATFEAVLMSEEGFYSEQGYWVPGGEVGLWGLYRGFASVMMNFISVSDYETIRSTTVQKTAEWYASGLASKEGLNTYMESLDPTGIDALNTANSYVVQWTFFVVIVAVVLGLFYVKYKRSG